MRRPTIADLRGRRTLLVASTGGHLTQLVRLAPRLGVAEDSRWLTFDTPQSRSLLAGRDVTAVPYISPRDLLGVVRGTLRAWREIGTVDAVVSTGAAIALAAIPQAVLRGKDAVYIESISRTRGPSLTGRILSRLPGVGLYTQHPEWADEHWRVGPSVLTDYRAEQGSPRPVRRMLVTLGTIQPYRFDRLVDVVLDYLREHPETEVTWQLGCTDREDLPGRVESLIPEAELTRLMQEADLVVAHSGVGIATTVLDLGKTPLLLDRRPELDEHVDHHQRQIFDHLRALGLAHDAEEVLATPGRAEQVAGAVVSADPDGTARTEGFWQPALGRALRVLQAGPAPETVGGMGIVADTLEKGLAPRAAHVRLRTIDSGGGRGRAGVPAFARSLGSVASREYDVLHLHVASRGSTLRKGLLAAIAAVRHRPYVIHLHGGGFDRFLAELGPTGRRLVTRFVRGAASVVTLGDGWRDLMIRELGADPDRVVVVRNGVVGIEPGPPAAERARRLLFVGTVSAAKGIPELCAAAEDLLTRPEFSDWSLAVLGGGADEPSRRALEDLRARIGDRLETPGKVTGPARDEFYRTSAALVLPSRAEGLPLVMLEAMSCGTVPVVSDVGAVAEVLEDGVNGVLVTPADVRALTDALERVMADPALRERLGDAARATWQARFTPEAMADALVDRWADAARHDAAEPR